MPGSQCCEHCAEILELREEIAELRARLDRLSGAPGDAAGSRPAQAKIGQPPAVQPPRQMVLPRPINGAPLPRVDQESSTQDKLGLYRVLFAGRSDVYAYRWENTADGTKGWSPKRRPGTTRDNPEYLPLTDDVIAAHLTKDNPAACGLCVMLADSTCRLLVCDFDGGTWRLDAAAYAEAAAWAGVPAAIEISRSGEGAHVWTFFAEPVAAVDARAMGGGLLREAMAIRGEMGMESYDRFFPAQDYLPRRGFGNLIALPLEGTCRKNGTTLFIDPATFKPFEDQFAFLSSIERMTRHDVVERAEELQPPMVGPEVWLHRSPLAEEPPPPEVIKAELSGMLAIWRAGLPPSLLSSLKHLASLHNPEFYSRQQIGLSVWGAPRMLRCYEESVDRLLLPRGVADRAAQLIEKAGSRLVITDLRSAPAELKVAFSGTLRAERRIAVNAVAAHELGVLVAPPGAGKTVMGCGVIAQHQVPTLILVDRTPLVDQWKERLREHLGLAPREIGQLGGGKKTKLSGRVDLATLQALTRADDPAKILSEYGLVIVDECHHVAAKTFAAAIRSLPARRWLGLTATPKRPDRREEIMFMQCGPVRHKIPSVTDLVQELHVHPTATTIREDIDSETPGILQSIIIPALVSDRTRTAQIVDDVMRAIRRGRNCLVMAGRTEHVDVLSSRNRTTDLLQATEAGCVRSRLDRAVRSLAPSHRVSLPQARGHRRLSSRDRTRGGKMGTMPSAESDLIIVSLVRYADSCEPTRRHSDCPFAVKRQGKLTCHEECRGVIKSLLRRGRGEPSSRLQAFDARQLRLSEPPGAPDILWHTSSLLQIVVQAARSIPCYRDGSLDLRRLVDATSALGTLGSRGLDPEHIVRRGVAGLVKLALAVWLGRKSDGRLINWEHFEAWQAIFEKGTAGQDSTGSYISAIFDGLVAQRLDAWIATASVEDIIMWRPPGVETESIVVEPDQEDTEVWTWVVDRFTQTYLDRWSLSSLKREYSFVQGSWQPNFSEVVLAERVVGREDVATALADRAIVSGDVIDPAMMQSFTEQALALLRDAQRTAAAALFNAARMLKPKDRTAQNNYAFCILLDKPEEAKVLLVDVLEHEGMDPETSWCNLALAESLLGHTDAALKACEQAYEDSSDSESYLWVREDDDWAVKYIKPRVWAVHFGVELEHSIEASSDIWAKRLENLTPLEQRAASSDPSSTGTDEEDL